MIPNGQLLNARIRRVGRLKIKASTFQATKQRFHRTTLITVLSHGFWVATTIKSPLIVRLAAI